MTHACSPCMPMAGEPLLAARLVAPRAAARTALAAARADLLALVAAAAAVVIVVVEESLRIRNVVDDETACPPVGKTAAHESAQALWSGSLSRQ